MQRARVTIGLMLLLSCNKEEAKGNAAAASASVPSPLAAAPVPAASPVVMPSPAVTAPAAPSLAAGPAPKCPAGLTGNPFPAYCIKLPPNYAVKQTRTTPTRGSIEYDTGTTTDNLMVSFDDGRLAQVAKDVESEMKFGGDKLEKKGDLSGGNKWFHGTHADYARVVTLFKGQGSLTLKCSFAYQSKKPPPKEALDTCKSIVVP